MPDDQNRLTLITRIFYGFLAFCVVMLIWQFYSYDRGIKQAEIDHPAQQHFFFYNTNAGNPSAPVAANRAQLRQVGFSFLDNNPTPGSFTCTVTLRNDGLKKAVNVQIQVRPFRGIALGDEDVGHSSPGTMSDSDPMAQISQWVSFPDIDPGQTKSQTATFIMQPGGRPGTNPNPDIQYDTAKDGAAPAH